MNARNPLLAACASAVLAGCGASTAAGPRARPEPAHPNAPAAANATFAYYDVTGATVAELFTSMRQQAPSLGFGQTLWNVTWAMRWEPTSGVCRVTQARVTLRTEVRLPRWEPGPGASPELVAQWRTFVENLRSHENGHLELAVAASREVERELRRIQTPSCMSVQGAGNQAAQRVISAFRARDRAYDIRTRGGATQGAVWPQRPAGDN
jgi:predicted secreted Zn-dependent protease